MKLWLLFFPRAGMYYLEDLPRLAKTLIANTSPLLWVRVFKRIQLPLNCCPAISPEVYLRYHPEYNVCTRAQCSRISCWRTKQPGVAENASALLEAMQEYHVTLEGET